MRGIILMTIACNVIKQVYSRTSVHAVQKDEDPKRLLQNEEDNVTTSPTSSPTSLKDTVPTWTIPVFLFLFVGVGCIALWWTRRVDRKHATASSDIELQQQENDHNGEYSGDHSRNSEQNHEVT